MNKLLLFTLVHLFSCFVGSAFALDANFEGNAAKVLDILGTNLMPVSTPDNLPSNPLILGLGANTFRVLFAVPMRIPPQLEFQALPAEASAKVIEKSKFGFTVVFEPISVPVTQFGFTASAEL